MITVIIAMYNMGDYISACLDSIYLQPFQDFEIILVDDGSTDNSLSIAEGYQRRLGKMKLIRQENQGQAAARNLALSHVTGDFIAYVDADDYLAPNALERMLARILETKSDMIITGYRRVFEAGMSGVDQIFEVPGRTDKVYSGTEVAEMVLCERVQGFLVNKLFRSELLKKIDFHQEEGKYIEDLFPIFNAIVNSSRIAFLEGYTYNYRQRAGSSSNERSERLMRDYDDAATKVLKKAQSLSGISSKALEMFKVISFLSLINYYTQSHMGEGIKIYRNFAKQPVHFTKPSLPKVLKLHDLSKKRKISLILWDLKIYHLAMKYWLAKKYD